MDTTPRNYDYEVLKKLAKKINKIKEKSQLISIMKIIKTLNPNVLITENENGMFIKFNSLTQETYQKIDNYLYKNCSEIITETETLSEYVPYSSEDFDSYRCKLSNKEKMLIKR